MSEQKFHLKAEMKDLYTLDDIDSEFKMKLSTEIGSRSLLNCIGCGICSSGCTVSEYIDLQPHRMVATCLLGLKDFILSSNAIWICSLCHRCTERCPKHVDYSFLLAHLRNLAVREGKIPNEYVHVIQNMSDGGLAIPTPGVSIIKRREKMDLPKYPEPNINQINKLIELNGLSFLLNKNNKKEV